MQMPMSFLARIRKIDATLLFCTGFVLLGGSSEAQDLTRDPSTFGSMTCQQIWYLEQDILAEGRVCPRSERARRAFSSAKKCISRTERILPDEVIDYLEVLRAAGRAKGCSGF